MRRLVLAAVGAVLLGGCADTHRLVREDATPGQKLPPTASVLVTVPTDGAYGAQVYHGSGRMTAEVVRTAFAQRTSRIRTASAGEEVGAAQAAGYDYLVRPTILHWEDRATEWSAIPDEVKVRIEVIDTASGQVVASGVVEGTSGLATIGGDSPEDLLPEPVAEFVASLY